MKSKLELVLSLLENEEIDKANELFHEVVVEKARSIYEEIIDETELEEDEAVEEDFGGDEKEDYMDDIKADEEEIEADEMYDETDEDEADDEDEVEDRVEDLEAALADLRAEFDRLMADELEEPNHAELASEIEGEEDEEYAEEGVYMEATKLQKEVPAPAAGSSDNVASPYKAGATEGKGEPVDFTDGSENQGDQSADSKSEAVEDNIDAPQKEQSAPVEKEGKVDAEAPLTKAPKK